MSRAVGIIPPTPYKVTARWALAGDKARPGAKSLYWQTQGGRVKYRQGWAGEKSGLFEHPAGLSSVVLDL